MSSSKGTVKTAVILAAGLGKRLRKVLSDLPKGFLRIHEETLIEQSISKLISQGVERIIIGTGHMSEAYENLACSFRQITCVKNARYASTGSMFTLYNLKDHIDDDFLLLESDLIYEKKALEALLSESRGDVILSSGRTHSGDEVFIEVDEDCNLCNLSKNPEVLNSVYSELVGISKISFETFQRLCEATADKPEIDYEHGLVEIAKGNAVFVKKVNDLAWCEIDDEEHLGRALAHVYPEIKRREAE